MNPTVCFASMLVMLVACGSPQKPLRTTARTSPPSTHRATHRAEPHEAATALESRSRVSLPVTASRCLPPEPLDPYECREWGRAHDPAAATRHAERADARRRAKDSAGCASSYMTALDADDSSASTAEWARAGYSYAAAAYADELSRRARSVDRRTQVSHPSTEVSSVTFDRTLEKASRRVLCHASASPEAPAVRYSLGTMRVAQKNYAEAIWLFDGVVAAKTDAQLAGYASMATLDALVAHWRKTSGIDSSCEELLQTIVQRHRGALCTSDGSTEACTMLKMTSCQLRIRDADVLEHQWRFAEASETLARVTRDVTCVSHRPDELLDRAAQLAARSGNHGRAGELREELRRRFPTSPRARDATPVGGRP